MDGDHRAEAVYLDGINCFDLCMPGGYVIFDDWDWTDTTGAKITQIGIQKFLDEKKGQYKLLACSNNNVEVQKL